MTKKHVFEINFQEEEYRQTSAVNTKEKHKVHACTFQESMQKAYEYTIDFFCLNDDLKTLKLNSIPTNKKVFLNNFYIQKNDNNVRITDKDKSIKLSIKLMKTLEEYSKN